MRAQGHRRPFRLAGCGAPGGIIVTPPGGMTDTRADGAIGPAAPGEPGTAAGRPGRAGAQAMLRLHWLIGALLAAGLVLRVLALIAYQPALVYVDSLKYLYGASPGSDPLGYLVVLRPLLLVGNLTLVAAVQHLAGLAMGAVLYVVLLRRGTNRWLAALAAAPVLLDAYQVQIEQMIMPDVWFEVLLVAGLAVLLWRPVLSVPVVAVAGLILGSSATVRQIGELLIFPVVLFLLVAMAGTGAARRVIRLGIVLVVAFAVPILAYCTVSYARTGHFWLARGQSTVGRVVAAADCATLRLPADVRPLCPTPAEQRFGPDWLEHSKYSPLFSTPVPPGARRGPLISELTSAIKSHQPLRVAGGIAGDSLRLFSVTRDSSPWIAPIWRWQFQVHYPVYPHWTQLGPGNAIVVGVQTKLFGPFHFSVLKPSYGGPAQVNHPIASFLRSYQLGGGFTPGPLLALFAMAGLAGATAALLRRGSPRTRALAAGALLCTGVAVVLLLAPDLYEFSWRYMLPAVVTLPPAGVLGFAALLGLRRKAGGDAPAS